MPRYKRFDELAERMKKFVIENIDKEEKDEEESMNLELDYLRQTGCCGNEISVELDHWNQMRLLMMYKYKNVETQTCFFMPYVTKRYLKHGIPSIVTPSVSSFVFQILYISFYGIAAILQIVKAQLDGSLSVYSQVCLILGSIFSIIFFCGSNNYVLILPPFMNILYACLLLFGIYNKCNQDISCVYSDL